MALAAYYAKLIYNANGGSGAPAAQSAYSDEPGASVYVILGAAPSRQYYTFKGWAPSASASSGRTPGGKYYMTTSTTLYAANARIYNLYATWQRNTVLIGYDPNGGSGSAWYQTVNQGEQITLSSTVPTRTGYKFLGWATSSTATSPAYQAGGKATFTRETRLYAVWEISNSTISSITGSVPIDGATQGSVSISSINNSYTHELTISIGESSQVINLAAGVSSANFTIPASWLAEVPNSTTGTARASLKTFNGSTQVGGADVKTFSITVPASIVPSLSVEADYVNSNAVVDGWDILLQNYSQIKLTATAAGGTGASISNIAFSGDGLSQTGSATEATSAVLTASGTRSWTVIATDSRGRTATATVTETVHEYHSPSIAEIIAYRADSSGNRDDAAGTYIVAQGSFSYASADGNNDLSVDQFEYQAEDEASWTVGQANVESGMSYLFGNGNITETKVFHIRLSLTDALGNSAQYVVDVSPIIGYGFGLKNDRVHFGGPCKEPGFVCDFDTKFLGVVDVIPRRAYATLSSSGWYRICTAQDESGAVFDFTIGRKYGSVRAEAHKITMLMVGGGQSVFTDESSASNVLCIDKIRCTYGDYLVHFDIHFNASSSEEVYVDYVVSGDPNVKSTCESEELISVNDAPSGETILLTYSFASHVATPLEYGITGSWRYRKWSDGRIEIWGVPKVTITLTAIGVYHRGSFTFDLPFTLSDLEMLQMTAYKDTLWYCLGNFTNGKTVTGYGYDVVDSSNYNTYVSVYAIGKI